MLAGFVQWLWDNKDWIFQGAGVAILAGLLSTPMRAAFISAFRRWHARAVLSGRQFTPRSAVVACLLLVTVAVALSPSVVPTSVRAPSARAPTVLIGDTGEDAGPSPEPETMGIAGAFVWLDVTRDGVEACNGWTDVNGDLLCTIDAATYIVSGAISGIPLRQQVRVATDGPVKLRLSLAKVR